MKISERILLAVAILMLGLALIACGPSAAPTSAPATQAPPPTQVSPAAQPTQAQVPTQAPPPTQATAEKTKVVVWYAGDEARWLQESGLIQKFEAANPQYTVEEAQYPWDALHDKLIAGFAGGDVPDVALAADQWIGEFAALNALEPLDDFFAKSGYKESDFLPTAWSHFKYLDGKLYAAPSYMEARVLFVRDDILQAAGVSVPKTLQELVDVGKKLSNGTDKFALAHQDQWLDFHFFSWILYAKGGDYYSADRTKCALTEPAAIDAIKYYKSLYENNIIPKDPAKRVDTFTGFKSGYYAMAESGPWWLGLLSSQAPELNGKWSAYPLPSDKTKTVYGHPNAFLVPANAKNKAGGEAWIKFWLTPEVGVAWAEKAGELPPAVAAYEDPKIASNKPLLVLKEAAMSGTNSIYNVPNGDPITQVVWNMLAEVRDSNVTPEEAAAKTCPRVEELLKK